MYSKAGREVVVRIHWMRLDVPNVVFGELHLACAAAIFAPRNRFKVSRIYADRVPAEMIQL